jgi:quercetin dioxygenase-like cupin family protein
VGNLGALDEARVRQVWEGVQARTLEGTLVTLAVIEIAPNTTVPEHRHPNEQIGVLAQGRLRFTVGDETRELVSGGTWTIPSGVPHSAQTGPEGAVAIETFAPRREDWDSRPLTDPQAPIWPAETGS